MPIIHDPMRVPPRTTTIYPAPFSAEMAGRKKRALTDRLGLTQFGVNLTTLEPGARSSQRHWHEIEDEFIYVLEGELTLVLMDGEHLLKPSMAVSFPAGDRNGHCLINKSSARATYLEIGTRAKSDQIEYPDIDMRAAKEDGVYKFFHKNGDPYE